MSTNDDNSFSRESITTKRGPISGAHKWLWAGYGACLFLYACLMLNLPVIAIPEAGVDDGLYVRGAINILKGDWLGPYDNQTLSKGPFYSVWIAFNSLTGLPILFSQGLLYGLGCLALARASRPWLRSELAAFGFFVFLLLSPIPVSEGQLRIMREGIYGPMTVLVVAGCIWWIRLKVESIWRRATLAIGLGLLVGCYWATREESVIIVTTLMSTLLAALYSAYFSEDRIRSLNREIMLSVLMAFVGIGIYGVFRIINLNVYGVPDVVEFKQPEFVSAYGALARIRHRESLSYVIVPREVLDRAFSVSPTTAELRTYFKQPGYVEAGCAGFKITPCDDEVHGAWFMWALRDAVAVNGHYKTAVEARRFYGAIADELNNACDAGKIECDARRDSMAPRFAWADVVRTLGTAGNILRVMATLVAAEPGNWGKPHSCFVDDCGASPLYRDFLEVTNSSLYTHPSWLPQFVAAGDRKPNDTNTNAQTRSVSVAQGLNGVATIYRAVLPGLSILAAFCYVLSLAIAGFSRSTEPTTMLASLALITLLTRVMFLAFLDAVAGMPSVNTLYLSSVYPSLLMFCFLSIASAVFHLRKSGSHLLDMRWRRAQLR